MGSVFLSPYSLYSQLYWRGNWAALRQRLGAHARSSVGACHLLCRRDNFELEILLYRACRICNRDYDVFDCGGVALSEDRLNFRVSCETEAAVGVSQIVF